MWNRGIWSDGRAASVDVSGNKFEWVRSDINADDYQNTFNIHGNDFIISGTGIAVGEAPGAPSVPSSITGINNNNFNGVNEEFSFRNAPAG